MNKFDLRLKKIEPYITTLLASIDEARGIFGVSIRMTPQAITTLKKSVIVTSAGASTRIEGSKLNDDEVRKIMQGLSIQKFTDRDSQEVQGYLEILQNVFDSYKSITLRESTIRSFHKELLKYSDKDILHRGQYKHEENIVGILDESKKVAQIIFETTPAWQTPKEMSELVEYTHEALEKELFHPLLIIANFIVEFLKIHPFQDGNGRLSRVITNLLLLKSEYQFVQYISHEQIIEKRKDEYYLALRESQQTFNTEKDSISPWLNFFLSVVKEQATKSLLLINKNSEENNLSTKQNEVWKFFENIIEASPREVVKSTHISMATVRQSLNRLVSIGKLKRVGHGRGTRYVRI